MSVERRLRSGRVRSRRKGTRRVNEASGDEIGGGDIRDRDIYLMSAVYAVYFEGFEQESAVLGDTEGLVNHA